jgi:hypothetical protein
MSICKVRGLALLLRVGTLWKCGDGLFFEVPPLASDIDLTTLHPLLENVLNTVDHLEISCLGAPFSYLDCMADVPMGFHRSTFSNSIQILSHAISGLFQPWKWSCDVINFQVINSLQYVFEKWVERCKKCIACQGRDFEKETVTAPPQSSDSE